MSWAPLAIGLIAVFAVLTLVLFCAIFCKRKNDSDFRYCTERFCCNCLGFCFEKHHCCRKENKNQCSDLSEGITDSLTISTTVDNGTEIISTPVANTEVMIVNNGIHPSTRNNDMHTGPRYNEIPPGLGTNAMHLCPATNEMHPGPRNIEIHAGTRNNTMHLDPGINEINTGPVKVSFDPHTLPPSYAEATVLDLFEHLHPTAPPLHS